jgi:hypothetical protein
MNVKIKKTNTGYIISRRYLDSLSSSSSSASSSASTSNIIGQKQ